MNNMTNELNLIGLIPVIKIENDIVAKVIISVAVIIINYITSKWINKDLF